GTQVMIDALPLGEIGGQHAPLDPAFGHIKDGIEHGPHTEGTRSSTAFSGRDQLFDPFPLLVGQVAWICFFVHISMLHNPRRLFRQALRQSLGNVASFLPVCDQTIKKPGIRFPGAPPEAPIRAAELAVLTCRLPKAEILMKAKENLRDLMMYICCALHDFRVHLMPWQRMISS